MELQVGVKVLLKNPEGNYLLLRRAYDPEQEVQGRWDVPGGRINPGSFLMENLAREVAEETGLNMTSEPNLVAAQDILKLPKRHIVRLTYVGTTEGMPVLSEEHTEYGWFSLEEIRTFENLDKYLKALLDGTIS
jgi:8-oxo-dGTP diphosphatase